MIGELPAGAALEEILEETPTETLGETLEAPRPITLWFVHDAPACLPGMRKLAAHTKLWILWRKGSSVTQPFLRESAAALGLVDYKICSVDRNWSAMLFARRKSK